MSSNTKKLIILVIGILLLSGFLSMVCGFSSLGFSFLSRSTSRGAGKTFQIRGNYSNIDIESETGNIRIHDAGKDSARVVWSGSSVMNLSVGTRSGTLKITERYRLPWFLRIGVNPGKSEIDVYLPRQDQKRLEIESDTGNINVPAGFSFSSADIETDTGAVDFQADVRGMLKIDTDTGRITCGSFEPENLEITSDTGAVNATDIRTAKDIKVKADTGKITLTNVKGEDLSAKSDTGSLSLVNTFAADSMKLETDTGSISLDRCDAGKIEIESDTGSVTGTFLTEKVFTVKTSTGRVNVPESSFGGECKIKTDTGNITIEITGK